MNQTEELIKTLKGVANVPQQVILGEVVFVDTGNQTADIKLDDAGNVKYTIRLKAVVDGNETGFVVFPAVGSKVLATKIYNQDEYFMLTCSEAQEVWLRGKENDGLVKISDLLEKINRIEDKLKSHQHAYIPYPGGSASTPVATTPATGLIPPNNTLVFTNTTQSDIENENVKHG